MKEIYLIIFIMSFLSSCTSHEHDQFDRTVPDSMRTFLQSDGLYSVLISKNRNVVLEEYFNGQTKDSMANVQSLTKSIMSILVGIAIDKQFIAHENESIVSYFPGQFSRLVDERKREITICHILNQTSGLRWRGYREHLAWLRSADPVYYVLSKKLANKPGLTYNYNSGATHLLSGIVSRASGMPTLSFARQFLFNPLNISQVQWEKRNDGNYDGSGFGLKMRPRDLLAIGQLLCDSGTVNSNRIISEAWVGKLFDSDYKLPTNWGLPGSTHGFCWYQVQHGQITINYGMGYGGQFIFLIPESGVVIVTTHNHDTIRGAKQQGVFLKKKLYRLIQEFS